MSHEVPSDSKVTMTSRPLRKPGAVPRSLGAKPSDWTRGHQIRAQDVEHSAQAVSGHLFAVTHEGGRRDVLLSVPYVGVRQLATPTPAPTIQYGEPGEPRTPPADWLAVWDEGSNAIEVAAYLGHLPPLAQMRASAAVARLALLPLGGELHRNLTGALDAVDTHLAGMHLTDTLRQYVNQLRSVEGRNERDGAPDFERHAMRAVICAVERAWWGWNMQMTLACASLFCTVVSHAWHALDHAPEFAEKRRARMAAMFDGTRDAEPPHPEILAVLRAVLGDDVYTTLPSFPVTVGGDEK